MKRKSGVGDAVSEKVEAGKFFDAGDAGADEDGGLAGVIGTATSMEEFAS